MSRPVQESAKGPPAEAELRLVIRARLAGAVISISAVLVGGCSQLHSSATSPLAGTWYATGSGLWVLMGKDEFQTENPEGEPGDAVLAIRDDGTLDLSYTILGGIEGIDRLRKKGDRVYLDATSSQSSYFQVESSTSSATQSELVLGQYYSDPAQNSKTIFSAQLVPPGRLLFLVGSYGPGARAGVETAVLKRY